MVEMSPVPGRKRIVEHPEGIADLRFTMKAIREPDDAPV
jgi:hypothetical protein